MDGQVRYTPDTGWFGADNDITYVVSDGTDTDTGRLHVTTSAPGNRPPTAKHDEVTVAAVPANAVTIDVLANDSDLDGDALSIARVSGVEHGTVEIVGKRLVLHYPADFKGTVEFSYVASDGQAESTATVKATVTNDDPKAVDDVRKEPVRPGQAVTLDVLGNDTDPNGDALTLEGVGVPSRGTAEIVDGKVDYRADPRALSGPDTFTYVVRDARGGFALGNVTLTVTAGRPAPGRHPWPRVTGTPPRSPRGSPGTPTAAIQDHHHRPGRERHRRVLDAGRLRQAGQQLGVHAARHRRADRPRRQGRHPRQGARAAVRGRSPGLHGVPGRPAAQLGRVAVRHRPDR